MRAKPRIELEELNTRTFVVRRGNICVIFCNRNLYLWNSSAFYADPESNSAHVVEVVVARYL